MKHIILNIKGNRYSKLGQLDNAIVAYEKAISIKPDYVKAIYNLANSQHKLGQLDKAVRNFKKLVTINPDYAERHNNKILTVIYFFSKGQTPDAIDTLELLIKDSPEDALLFNMMGGCCVSLGQFDMAIKNYENALNLHPNYAIPQHMLNSLKGNTSKEPPKEYVKNLFDDYAERFDDSLVEGLQYQLPFIIKDIIQKTSSSNSKFLKTIDLGCGTGLSGKDLREISKNLSGVDISENMVSKAEELNIYDNLFVGDIIEVLGSAREKYDLFVALDVLVYVGDVESIFKAVRTYCYRESLFVFSIEVQEEDGYSLLKNSRYAHSDSYITNQAAGSFVLVDSQNLRLRKEGNNWINGKIYIFKAA
jgi:predicted TPR repeat methyltransferase